MKGESIDMKKEFLVWIVAPVLFAGLLAGCLGSSSSSGGEDAIVVNTLADGVYPASAATVTIRDAVDRIKNGGTITFDVSLNGETIDLDIVGEEHSILKGEVFFLVLPPPPPPYWRYDGYLERDYGASALYAAKDLTIDASDLPDGITLNWTGGEANPARVMAVSASRSKSSSRSESGSPIRQPVM